SAVELPRDPCEYPRMPSLTRLSCGYTFSDATGGSVASRSILMVRLNTAYTGHLTPIIRTTVHNCGPRAPDGNSDSPFPQNAGGPVSAAFAGVSLATASTLALVAWGLRAKLHTDCINLGDVAGACAFIGFAAGIVSQSEDVLELFGDSSTLVDVVPDRPPHYQV